MVKVKLSLSLSLPLSLSLSIIRHPNIVLLMAVCCGPTKADMFLAMEPLQTASLYEQLHGQQIELSTLEAADIVYDVTSGEQYVPTTVT